MNIARRALCASSILASGLLSASALAQTPAPLPDAPSATAHDAPAAMPTGPTVLFDTSMGRLTCQLFDKEAPQTVANFIGLATGTKTWTDPKTLQKVTGKPFYDGTQFHRVIPGFMIQGGDPLANGMGDAGFYLPDEISPALRFDVPGRLAMANSGPNTNSSQFFITELAPPATQRRLHHLRPVRSALRPPRRHHRPRGTRRRRQTPHARHPQQGHRRPRRPTHPAAPCQPLPRPPAPATAPH